MREFSLSILLALALLLVSVPFANAQWGGDARVSVRIPGGEEGGGGGGSDFTNLRVSGYAYPDAFIRVLRNGGVAGTARARSDGTFTTTLWARSGSATIGAWARDGFGLISQTWEVSVYIPKGYLFTISDVFISPTLGADRLIATTGARVRIYGSAFPGSAVKLFTDIPGMNGADIATAGADGKWEYFLNTSGLAQGLYSLRVNSRSDLLGMLSGLSREIKLGVGFPIEPYEGTACAGADLNLDGRVNITDFSIMLYYWELDPLEVEPPNYCVDQDGNRVVDIYDFSRLMYAWRE